MSYRIAIRVTPRSAKPGIGGWRESPQGRELEVRVREAPTDGAANEAVIRLLADRLRLPKSSVEILSGQASRHKRVQLPLAMEEVIERLGA